MWKNFNLIIWSRLKVSTFYSSFEIDEGTKLMQLISRLLKSRGEYTFLSCVDLIWFLWWWLSVVIYDIGVCFTGICFHSRRFFLWNYISLFCQFLFTTQIRCSWNKSSGFLSNFCYLRQTILTWYTFVFHLYVARSYGTLFYAPISSCLDAIMSSLTFCPVIQVLGFGCAIVSDEAEKIRRE